MRAAFPHNLIAVEKEKSNRVYNILLFFSVLLFLAMFGMLSVHNRLVVDDWDYLGSLGEPGIWGYVKHLYLAWSGRWAAYPLTGLVVSLHDVPFSLAAFNTGSVLVLWFTVYLILRRLFAVAGHTVSKSGMAIHAALLCMALFFTSYSKGETWFWLVHVCVYLWSIIMSLVLTAVLLDRRWRKAHGVLIPVAALYIGGAAESFALVDLALTVVLALLVYWGRTPPLFRSDFTKRKTMWILAFMLTGFLVTMAAPGNENRMGALPHVAWYETVWIFMKSCVKIFFIRFPMQWPLLVLLCLPWLWLGSRARGGEPALSITGFLWSIRKKVFWFCLLIAACLVPTAVMMSELGPDRALAQITFFMASGMAWFFYRAGRQVDLPGWFHYAKLPATLLLCFWVAVTCQRQYGIVREYARAYDARWEMLEKLQREGHRSLVELQPLPPSGFLSAGEITADTNHFSNNFLEHALHLGFEIKLKE